MRVVVVGGGISGLTAAWHLARTGKHGAMRVARCAALCDVPAAVAVLEAAPRLGGNILVRQAF